MPRGNHWPAAPLWADVLAWAGAGNVGSALMM
jgi:hypothetical protein